MLVTDHGQFSVSYCVPFTEIILLRFVGSFLTNSVRKLEPIFSALYKKNVGDEVIGGQYMETLLEQTSNICITKMFSLFTNCCYINNKRSLKPTLEKGKECRRNV